MKRQTDGGTSKPAEWPASSPNSDDPTMRTQTAKSHSGSHEEELADDATMLEPKTMRSGSPIGSTKPNDTIVGPPSSSGKQPNVSDNHFGGVPLPRMTRGGTCKPRPKSLEQRYAKPVYGAAMKGVAGNESKDPEQVPRGTVHQRNGQNPYTLSAHEQPTRRHPEPASRWREGIRAALITFVSLFGCYSFEQLWIRYIVGPRSAPKEPAPEGKPGPVESATHGQKVHPVPPTASPATVPVEMQDLSPETLELVPDQGTDAPQQEIVLDSTKAESDADHGTDAEDPFSVHGEGHVPAEGSSVAVQVGIGLTTLALSVVVYHYWAPLTAWFKSWRSPAPGAENSRSLPPRDNTAPATASVQNLVRVSTAAAVPEPNESASGEPVSDNAWSAGKLSAVIGSSVLVSVIAVALTLHLRKPGASPADGNIEEQ